MLRNSKRLSSKISRGKTLPAAARRCLLEEFKAHAIEQYNYSTWQTRYRGRKPTNILEERREGLDSLLGTSPMAEIDTDQACRPVEFHPFEIRVPEIRPFEVRLAETFFAELRPVLSADLMVR